MSAEVAVYPMPGAQQWDQKHPWWTHRSKVWEFNSDHYGGGRALVESERASEYLIQFAQEGAATYAARTKRSKGLYENLPKRALQVYQAQLFRVKPVRTLPKAMVDLEGDVDLQGTDADEFFRQVYEEAQLFGQSYVLVDSPQFDENMTEEERVAGNLRPYFERIPVLHLIDWDVEIADATRRGQLNYIVIKDELLVRPGPFMQPQKKTRYRVWTREVWQIWETQIQPSGDVSNPNAGTNPLLVNEGPNEVGEIPLAIFYDERKEAMQGATLMDDVALKANALWHRCSVEDESFHLQGFPQMYVRTEKEVSSLTLSQTRAIHLNPPDDDIGYLTAPDGPTKLFGDFWSRMIESVADLVFARTSRQQPTAQVESADKRRLDRAELEALLSRKASMVEFGEEQCWIFAAAWLGESLDEVDVAYNREFSIDGRTAIEWQTEIAAGVANRVEWYRAINPGSTDEEAVASIMENLDLEAVFKGAEMEAMAPLLGAMGEAGIGPDGQPLPPDAAPPDPFGGEAPPEEAPPEGEEPEPEEPDEEEDDAKKKKKAAA